MFLETIVATSNNSYDDFYKYFSAFDAVWEKGI